ncbi:PadR family transcriptional regulator [[Eubacterium] cellulosolvens]
MRTEDIRRIVLKMVYSRTSGMHGYEIHKLLASERVKVEQSRLYRVLNEMLREGLLESRWEKSQFGPKKRVYLIGDKGRRVLNKILGEAIETVHSFYEEYLQSLPPKSLVFDKICKPLTEGLKKEGNIAYVTPKYSQMNKRMIHTLQKKVPQGKIYLVIPGSVPSDLKFDNIISLNGSYGNIPLKNNYVDLILIIDIPPEDVLETAAREWRRALKQNGKIAILMPTALIHKYEDPLTIGNFIEKYEHETKRKGKYMDREFLEGVLKKFFTKVEERQIVHMTIFLLSKPRSPL